HGVLYINTSVELWDPYASTGDAHPTVRTLYWRHMNLRRLLSRWTEPGPTAVLEHGANPGLLSHFTKPGLLAIDRQALADKRFTGARAERIAQHAKDLAFNHLAHQLGVKVIHCSERDTQITNQPKEVEEFVNTWSVEGFREEGTTTAELGWGTHEKELPTFAFEHSEGPRSQINRRARWTGNGSTSRRTSALLVIWNSLATMARTGSGCCGSNNSTSPDRVRRRRRSCRASWNAASLRPEIAALRFVCWTPAATSRCCIWACRPVPTQPWDVAASACCSITPNSSVHRWGRS